MNLSTVFAKMAMLILIMLLGYLCARIGITGPEFNKRVTPLMVTVLMPDLNGLKRRRAGVSGH